MPTKDISIQPETEKYRLVTLTVTEDCNLRCRYCYEPTKTRDRYMSLNVAQKAITYYMEADDEFKLIEFDFFGGEPLLGFNLIRDAVDWFHSRSWTKGHRFFIGTNGTVLSEEMKPWLVANKQCVQIGLSLDGNKAAHDVNRSNSYDQVMRNLPFFQEHWPDQPIKMTISAESIPHVADSIIEMEEMGLVFSVNVVFEDIWGSPEQKSALLEIYEQQLDRLVEYYVAHPHLFPAMIVDRKLESIGRPNDPRTDCVRFCGAGHEMVMVDVDGNQYPCHRFSPWVTGRSAPEKLVNRQATWKPEKCAECRYVTICPTCAGFNWQENGDSGIRSTYHCEAFKLELLASAKLQALKLLNQQSENLAQLPFREAHTTKSQIDMILDFATNGV